MVDIPSVPLFPEVLDDWPSGVHMLQNGWRPTGGAVNPAADEGLLNWPLQELVNRTAILKRRVDRMSQSAAVEFTVGAGGDFSTINAALAELSAYSLGYVPLGIAARLRLLPGFIMAEQVSVYGINLGWVTIVGDDAMTTIDRAAMTAVHFVDRYPAFAAGDGGILPVIDHLFEMSSGGDATNRDGILVFGAGSGARIRSGKGIRRAGWNGITLRGGATAALSGADFRQAGQSGLLVADGSSAAAPQMVAIGCGRYGVEASDCSSVSASGATLTGCTSGGIRATTGARVSAQNAAARTGASDASGDMSVALGGVIAANGATGGTSITANTVTSSGIIFK